MEKKLIHAIVECRPGAEWNLVGNDFDNIEWLSNDIEKPTKEEVNNKLAELIEQEPSRLLRIKRNQLLEETDWWALSDIPITEDRKKYRQQLRDLPSKAAPVLNNDYELDESSVNWPVKPE